MKKNLMLSLVCLLSTNIFAQTFSVDTDNASVSGDISSSVIEVAIHVDNISAAPITLRWRLIPASISLPSGWTTSVCDINGCYSPSTYVKDFNMAIGALDAYVKVSFIHNGNIGTGTEQILLFDIADSAGTVQTLNYEAIVSPVSINEIKNEISLNIFPNPTNNLLFLDIDPIYIVSKIEVYSVVGAKIMEQYVNPAFSRNSIDVSNLKNGMYFVRILDLNNKVLKATNFTKN